VQKPRRHKCKKGCYEPCGPQKENFYAASRRLNCIRSNDTSSLGCGRGDLAGRRRRAIRTRIWGAAPSRTRGSSPGLESYPEIVSAPAPAGKPLGAARRHLGGIGTKAKPGIRW
jgi:hypothetical protein